MIGRLKRLSERDWDVLDRMLAALAFTVMALALTIGHRQGPEGLEVAIAAVLGVALLWRRRKPLAAAVVVVTGSVIVLGVLASPNTASPVACAIIIAAYSTGAHLDLRRSLLGFVLVVGGIAAVCIAKSPDDIFFPVVFFGAVPWAVGRVFRGQTALARELTEKAESQEIARDQAQARAASAERARVARELHDVLAHNLSVMVIQASAAQRIAAQDPTAAVRAAELISRTGREALSELRYVFGPVRKEEGDALGASPGLSNLDHLVSRAHRSGLPVELRVEGEPLPLSPGADLAAYRVVQEALTNTLKHSQGARARVTVRYGRSDVEIEVLDDGSAAVNGHSGAGGHGLVGMRERMALYGGQVEAGTRPAGGFAVRARLPVRRGAG